MSNFLSGSGPRAIAHRGWHTGDLIGLENTAVAFDRAVKEGYRYLETDVHVTADGALVAFHDSSLDRVTNAVGRIDQLTWAQVSKAKIDGREPIPLLADLLGDFPEARFNIDPKSDHAVGPLIDAIRATKAIDRVCLGSFSDRRLKTLRSALGDAVATSLGPRQVAALLARGRSSAKRVGGPAGVAAQVPLAQSRFRVVTPRFIDSAHHLGLEVHVWTIDDPAQMQRLLDMGVDGILTDRPDLLRDVLAARGASL